MLFVSDGCDGRNFHSKEFAGITRTEVVSLPTRAYPWLIRSYRRSERYGYGLKNLQKQFIATIKFHSWHSPLNLFYHSLCCFKNSCSLFQMGVMEEIFTLKNYPVSPKTKVVSLAIRAYPWPMWSYRRSERYGYGLKKLQKQLIATRNFHSWHSPLNLFYHSLCCFNNSCFLFQMGAMEEIFTLMN